MLVKFGNKIVKFGDKLVSFTAGEVTPEGIIFLTAYDAGYTKITAHASANDILFEVFEPTTELTLTNFTVCDGHGSQYGYGTKETTQKIVDKIFYNTITQDKSDLTTWQVAASDFTLTNVDTSDKEDDYYIHNYSLSTSLTLTPGNRYFIPVIGNNSNGSSENIIYYNTETPTRKKTTICIDYTTYGDEYFDADNIASYAVDKTLSNNGYALKLNGDNV